MKNQYKLVLIAAIAAFACLLVISLVVSKSPANFRVVILHNNDLHSRFEQTGIIGDKCSVTDADNNRCFGGFARIAYKVQEFRARSFKGDIPKVLFLNAGDTYTGTPWFQLFKDEIASEFLNKLKPDAMVINFLFPNRNLFKNPIFSLSEITNLTKAQRASHLS